MNKKMKKLHFTGNTKGFDITEHLSDNYDTGLKFYYPENEDDVSEDVIENVKLSMFFVNTEMTVDEANKGYIKQTCGSLECTGNEYGYSEYTIEGFYVSTARIGGHDINKIIQNSKYKYVHVLFEQVTK